MREVGRYVARIVLIMASILEGTLVYQRK